MSDRKWLRHWENFDWSEISERLFKAADTGGDIGITKEEMRDYLEWLKEHNEMLFMQAYFMQLFMEKGLDEEEAEFLTEHIDVLMELLENQHKQE